MSEYRVDDETLESMKQCGGAIKAAATELLALRRDFAELLQAARLALDYSDESQHFRHAAQSKAARASLAAIIQRHGA